MSIRPVVDNGMIQRTQDVGNIKQHEDSRPTVQQQIIGVQQEKQEDQLTHQVQQPDRKENDDYRYDAREKGNNKYEDRRKKKKRQKESEKEEQADGKVIFKGHTSSFDIKI